MPKMFGFSRRKTKLGRLKSHHEDPSQGTKSPMRPTKHLNQSNSLVKEENVVKASFSGRSEDYSYECSPDASNINKCAVGNFDNWMMLSTSGDKPTPRFHHAATVVGSKMLVVGGESGHGMLDDTMILNLDKLTWATSAPKIYLPAADLPLKIPSCKGHCLVSWNKRVLLVGGKTDPSNEKLSVWSFDVETECWSNVEAKGDIPVSRSGHTALRAGPVIILFGGEDTKGKKLNDLHMFDLKSSTWLPLNYTGSGPSPRSNHVATLYDDKTLFVFGGQAKSKILNDLYSLDFETMIWTRVKAKGHHPASRAGCCGALYGSKWYIVGGGSKKKRYAETLVFDISKTEWSVCVSSQNPSVITNKGYSLVTMNHRDKMFLVAFGGNKKEPSNQIEILVMVNNEHSSSWRSAPDLDPSAYMDCTMRNVLESSMEHNVAGRKSLSDSPIDSNPIPSSSSLRKQFQNESDYNLVLKSHRSLDSVKYKEKDNALVPTTSFPQAIVQKGNRKETTVHMDIAGILASTEENILMAESGITNLPQNQAQESTDPSNINQMYETKIATLTRKNSLLEGQLKDALKNLEAAEKNLSSAIKSKQDMERTLGDATKEVEILKEKFASLELAQEEVNSLSNIVHSDNVRLEHDVAFLKAILDDTQKELHSTRGVLAAERTRAFQLQVEVFHLKQRFQSLENRSPTTRKPYRM